MQNIGCITRNCQNQFTSKYILQLLLNWTFPLNWWNMTCISSATCNQGFVFQLEKHDKDVSSRQWRSDADMEQEAATLRPLFSWCSDADAEQKAASSYITFLLQHTCILSGSCNVMYCVCFLLYKLGATKNDFNLTGVVPLFIQSQCVTGEISAL